VSLTLVPNANRLGRRHQVIGRVAEKPRAAVNVTAAVIRQQIAKRIPWRTSGCPLRRRRLKSRL